MYGVDYYPCPGVARAYLVDELKAVDVGQAYVYYVYVEAVAAHGVNQVGRTAKRLDVFGLSRNLVGISI